MKEGQGYLGIDLEGLFAAIDKQVTTGGRVGDKFEGASIPSEDLSAAEQGVLENRRMGFLEDTFSRDKSVEDLAEMDIRKTAITFKEEFESWHDNVLLGASPQEDKELAKKQRLKIWQIRLRVNTKDLPGISAGRFQILLSIML